MVGLDLIIAIGNDEQCVEFVDASTKKLEEIERCFISPVNVFDNQNGGGLILEFVENGGEDGRTRGFFFEQRKEVATDLSRDVGNGAEWSRGEQRIAAAPQNAKVLVWLRMFVDVPLFFAERLLR